MLEPIQLHPEVVMECLDYPLYQMPVVFSVRTKAAALVYRVTARQPLGYLATATTASPPCTGTAARTASGVSPSVPATAVFSVKTMATASAWPASARMASVS